MISGEAIEEILRRHSGNLDEAAKALVKAANRGGGVDNITAVLFQMVEGEAGPPPVDERTQEYALPAVDADDEDTLHPEDGVAPPPAASDTMVVPVSEINAAIDEHPAPQAGTPQAGIARRLLALLVIIALIAVIVVLVWQGLAR
jgi:hypothetical protein